MQSVNLDMFILNEMTMVQDSSGCSPAPHLPPHLQSPAVMNCGDSANTQRSEVLSMCWRNLTELIWNADLY